MDARTEWVTEDEGSRPPSASPAPESAGEKTEKQSRLRKFASSIFGADHERSRTFFAALLCGGAFVLTMLITWHVLGTALHLPGWEVALVALSLFGLAATFVVRWGFERCAVWAGWLLIYLSGGLIVRAFAGIVLRNHGGEILARVHRAFRGGVSFSAAAGSMARAAHGEPRRHSGDFEDAARLSHAKQEAELRLLPSHGWYLIAIRVTGLAMVGSFATTAIGFFEEIVDPHSPTLLRYGIPCGLSALAALIIWAGWDYVFRRMRVAKLTPSRVLVWGLGTAVLLPLTVAIHSVFGVIGVGGTEGLRAHHLWYADVLSGYYDLADRVAKAELKMKPQISLMAVKFAQSAERERNGGSGCGAGEGDLYRYYSDRAKDAAALLKLIEDREASFAGGSGGLGKAIEDVRRRIRDPGKPFRDAQTELGESFKDLRSRILSLDARSVQSSLQQFIGQLAIVVENDGFFKGWAECQVKRKPVVQAEIQSFLDQARKSLAVMQADIAQAREEAARHIPAFRRIDSLDALLNGVRWKSRISVRALAPSGEVQNSPMVGGKLLYVRMTQNIAARSGKSGQGEPPATSEEAHAGKTETIGEIQSFVPLRPFWAVVTYASQLPGYIALQAALDFSPAILGFLFALLAPLKDGGAVGWFSKRVNEYFERRRRRDGGQADAARADA